MIWRGDNHNVSLVLLLAIFSVIFSHCLGADVIVRQSRDMQVSNQQKSLETGGESVSKKLIHMRQLLKTIFLDWNFGESDLKGAIARTFGRVGMMRKIMLPMVFMGGFFTAVIISIKLTGVVNMLLIGKVLLLQLAIVLGKIVWGAKELLMGKHGHHHESYASPPQAYFIPVSQGGYSHSNSYASSREDDSQPNYYSGQQSFNQPSGFRQPQFNKLMNYPLSFSRPQQNYEPQNDLFRGFPMQMPNQIQSSSQFSQPFNQGRTQDYADFSNFESYDSRIPTENSFNNQLTRDLSRPQTTTNSLSPQEMTQLLSDTIAQMAARTQATPIYKRSPNIPNYVYGSRS